MRAVAVAGPTASGKSALALELARRYCGEIISCDSMQIYRGMDIGTAKPTKEERAEVAHHMIDILDPGESYSAASYASDATGICEKLDARGVLPIICGGTGLYLEALRDRRFSCGSPGSDDEYRDALRAIAEEEGGRERLHKMLRDADPSSAEAIHPNNVKRVIRALEIHHLSSRPKSEWDDLSKESDTDGGASIEVDAVAIVFEDRELLYHRIERRVDEMISLGLLDEIARLDSDGVFDTDSTASAAIGYKELLPALRGEAELNECIERLKTATRRYAKRQITWFSHRSGIHTLYADEGGRLKSSSQLADEVERLFPYLSLR